MTDDQEPTKLGHKDVVDALRLELDDLVVAINVEPDERPALARAAKALFAGCQRMLAAQHLDWPPDAALAVVEVACINEDMFEHAAAVHTIREYNQMALAEQAKMN